MIQLYHVLEVGTLIASAVLLVFGNEVTCSSLSLSLRTVLVYQSKTNTWIPLNNIFPSPWRDVQ